MFRPPRLLLIAPLLGLAVISCNETTAVTDPIEARRIPQEIVADVDAIVASNTTFAFDVYRQVGKKAGNVFISPFSISTALAMTMAGAAGTTEDEMAAVTHLTLPRETLHPAFGAVLGSLDRGSALGGYRLSLANRLWGQSDFEFEQPFLDITREDYGAEMGRVDFLREPEACRQEINTWVENRTEGRIQDLFPEGGINPNTVLALVNAIYFKGNWVTEFDPEETAIAPFRVDAGSTVQTPLMHGKFEARTARMNGVQVLELPYRGEDLSMVFLLPESPDGMAALEASLSAEALAGWIGALHETEIDIYLPKFEIEWKLVMNDALSAMGMPSAFGAGEADFTNLHAPGGLFIQMVVHQAFVKVDEVGTEAAAATGVSIGRTSLPPEFRADRPFLFLIRDHVTGSVLFLGRLSDPTA